MKESYFMVDKRVTPCTEPSGYQKDKRGSTQFYCRYVKMGSVPQTGSGMKTKRKTKKKTKN